jgi:hypothetical protein
LKTLALFALLLTACSGLAPSSSDTGDLMMALTNYTRLIRWQRWSDAATYVPEETKGQWLQEKMRGAQGLNIADVALAGVEQAGTNAEEAVAYVRIAWYRGGDMTLRESVWKQQWKLARGEGWRMQSEEAVEAPPAEDVPPPSWP